MMLGRLAAVLALALVPFAASQKCQAGSAADCCSTRPAGAGCAGSGQWTNSVCYACEPHALDKNPDYQCVPTSWHCPAFSVGFIATKKFGGCDPAKGVDIDCCDTDVDAVLEEYGWDEATQTCTNPPEGTPDQCKYTALCFIKQCKDATVTLPDQIPGGAADLLPDAQGRLLQETNPEMMV